MDNNKINKIADLAMDAGLGAFWDAVGESISYYGIEISDDDFKKIEILVSKLLKEYV